MLISSTYNPPFLGKRGGEGKRKGGTEGIGAPPTLPGAPFPPCKEENYLDYRFLVGSNMIEREGASLLHSPPHVPADAFAGETNLPIFACGITLILHRVLVYIDFVFKQGTKV